jgi:hypothetical protein
LGHFQAEWKITLIRNNQFLQDYEKTLNVYGDVIIWIMATKHIPYMPPKENLYLDQKRKLGLIRKIKKQIAKFDLKPEDIGFVKLLILSI